MEAIIEGVGMSVKFNERYHVQLDKSCNVCDSNIFYKNKNSECVQCKRDREKKRRKTKQWCENEISRNEKAGIFESNTFCDKCGNNYRYIKNGKCVPCYLDTLKVYPSNPASNDEILSIDSEYDPEVNHFGKLCMVCGSTLRYNSHNGCILCARKRINDYTENKVWLDHIEGEIIDGKFTGKPCAKCGSRIRYENSGSCVECSSEHGKRVSETKPWIRKDSIIDEDGLTFVGDVCIKCGGNIRLISNNQCRECRNREGRQRKKDRTWLQHSKEILDDTYYIRNDPCVSCGDNLFYVISGGCVNCNRTRGNEVYKTKAWLETDVEEYIDDTFYTSLRKCDNCDDNIRYIAFGACRTCTREYGIQTAHKRRSLLEDAGTFSEEEWLEMLDYYGYKCLSCREEFEYNKLERDHVIPVSLGGYNTIYNIEPLCKSCNCSKNARLIDYRDIGDKYRQCQNIE